MNNIYNYIFNRYIIISLIFKLQIIKKIKKDLNKGQIIDLGDLYGIRTHECMRERHVS